MKFLAMINIIKKYLENYQGINFLNVKKFLIEQGTIAFCSKCEPRFQCLGDDVCLLCLDDAFYLEKFLYLIRDFEFDVSQFWDRTKKF